MTSNTVSARLIYRGVAHGSTTKARPTVAQDLVYRGVRHDGRAPASVALRQDMPMRYRSVAYTIPAAIQAADIPEPGSDEMDFSYKLAV